jgi:N-succinyldiaminopimelate aminotransferase
MNPDLDLLQPYPFEKLRALLADISPADLDPISLSVGEPRHTAPVIVQDALRDALGSLEQYPSTRGSESLRQCLASWICRRYSLANAGVDLDLIANEHVIPVNGTREGLFAIAQCLLDRRSRSKSVLMPNPFYQIYEGAALLAGCEPDFYAIDENADRNLQAITDERFKKCQLIYVCTPGNPTGAITSMKALQWLIEKAHENNFVIVSDECYSEIYRESDTPPCGLLQAAAQMGRTDFSRCLAFHSLSKRSNLPGMRSGFVAGDASLIKRFVEYRTYQGCAMSGTVQQASIAAWSDEEHVEDNRRAYDAKYSAVTEILSPKLPVTAPPGGFYLWPELPVDDQYLTRLLLEKHNVRVVPGSFLARATPGMENPGQHRIRLALVASLNDCSVAAARIVDALDQI